MTDRVYMLSIRELLDGKWGEQEIEDILWMLDEDRRSKINAAKHLPARYAGLAAGLLLRYALWEAISVEGTGTAGEQKAAEGTTPMGKNPCMGNDAGLIQLTLAKVLVRLKALEAQASLREKLPLPTFRYGANGKPYLTNYPYYFNISHSGEYVVCALSEREIGIDIQKHKADNVIRLAERFFSERERESLRKCPVKVQAQQFFDLWARKEAYGKMTGEGVVGVLNLDLTEGRRDAVFEKYSPLAEYSIVVCKRNYS